MKKNIIIFIFLTIFSRLVLSLSGMAEPPFADMLYVLAFGLPILVGIPLAERDRRRREEIAGVKERWASLLSLRPERAVMLLPLVFVSVAAIFFVAYLGYLLISILGGELSGGISGSLFELLLTSALLPSVTEEMLFRLLPMKLVLPYSRKWTVILSAVSFSVFHLNYEQYLYTFVAGIIFILTDIAFESILPSMLMHLANNVASIVWMRLGESDTYSLAFVLTLIALAAVSMIFIIVKRRKYAVLFAPMRYGDRNGKDNNV